MFAGKKSAQIREILISESAWEEMTCLFAPSLTLLAGIAQMEREQLLLRQREGYEAAKAAGRIAGRGNGRGVDRTGIYAALARGESVRSIASAFEVSTNTISRIKKEMAGVYSITAK